MMKYLLILLMSGSLYAQVDLESIVDRNPFDPDRGQKEETSEEENQEEEAVITDDMPVLDGTIIIGDTRIALFSIVREGKPAKARVLMNTQDNQYTLYVRDKEDPVQEENGKLAGYTIKQIQHDFVELEGMGKRPVQLKVYQEGSEKSRGGSKKAGGSGKKRDTGVKELGRPKDNRERNDKPRQEMRGQRLQVKPKFGNQRDLPSNKKKSQGKPTKEDLKKKF